jgi:protein-disulfide isomerase
MPKSKTTPLLVIVAAVIVAGSIALYLSQKSSTSAQGIDQGSSGAATTAIAPAPGGGRVRGAPDARITLVEYGDYQCPTCGTYHPITMELLNRYSGKFKLEFHHFPLIQMHSNAMGAALAAEAAGDQGKFWEMHDLLFENQQAWGDLRNPNPNAEAVFLQFALQLGLDSNKFMQAVRSPATRDRILADVAKGSSIVKGTPTFVLDGQVLPNLPNLQWFVDYIDRQLATPAK